jgi:uncharacterized protein (DUF1501 family)
MTEPVRITRRALLVGGLAAVGTAAVGGTLLPMLGRHGVPTGRSAVTRDRLLVVIEMAGGNDGLTMAVPTADPLYRQLRRRTAIDPASTLSMSDGVGLHPSLRRLHGRGVAVLRGVGVPQPDLSHFEMLRRLWLGDVSGRTTLPTGFLGRLCDAVGDPAAPVVGVSVSTSPSLALASQRVATAALPGPEASAIHPDDATLGPVWDSALRAMSQEDRAAAHRTLNLARHANAGAMRLSSVLAGLPPASPGYPAKNDLGQQLSFTARLLAANVGVRVVHVPASADFDTHSGHLARARSNLDMLDAALGAFLDDLERRGLLSRTLVLTTSEFGRRAEDNADAGLDHGTASTWLLAGAVRRGVHGEAPRLDRLDDDGNVRATVGIDEVYATVAEGWLGVPAGDVLPGSPRPLPGVL